MSSTLATLGNSDADIETMHALMTAGDLSGLTKEQQAIAYLEACRDLGLNWRTKPFIIAKVGNGPATLYPTVEGIEQLAAIHHVDTHVDGETMLEGIYSVRVRAVLPNGRGATKTGKMFVKGMNGQALANAMMKAESKAYRRAVRAVVSLNSYRPTDPTAKPIFEPPEPAIVAEAVALVIEPPQEEPAAEIDAGDEADIPTAEVRELTPQQQAIAALAKHARRVLGHADRADFATWIIEHGFDPTNLTPEQVAALEGRLMNPEQPG